MRFNFYSKMFRKITISAAIAALNLGQSNLQYEGVIHQELQELNRSNTNEVRSEMIAGLGKTSASQMDMNFAHVKLGVSGIMAGLKSLR